MPKPTIAQVPGPAAGAGLALALACDLRYAADTAIFTTAFARVAFAGDYGGTWFLTRLVGPAKAKELYYFSERLTADQAEELGLVNAVFPAGDLEKEVMDRARRLAQGPSIAYRYMKENLNRAVHGSLEECMDLEVTITYTPGLRRTTRRRPWRSSRSGSRAFAIADTVMWRGPAGTVNLSQPNWPVG
jgi:2-(1,2-epoxy-1,2-dihydrophenyl)acetyl-CoA isomerase